jgi:hypothetical protein
MFKFILTTYPWLPWIYINGMIITLFVIIVLAQKVLNEEYATVTFKDVMLSILGVIFWPVFWLLYFGSRL